MSEIVEVLQRTRQRLYQIQLAFMRSEHPNVDVEAWLINDLGHTFEIEKPHKVRILFLDMRAVRAKAIVDDEKTKDILNRIDYLIGAVTHKIETLGYK